MTGLFEATMARVALMERGYSNDPTDRGGETNHGITIAVARAFGYRGAMRDMTRAEAMEIYRARYWTQPAFDRIVPISPEVAGWLLDCGLNMGQAAAGTIRQRVLNALNDRGALPRPHPGRPVRGDDPGGASGVAVPPAERGAGAPAANPDSAPGGPVHRRHGGRWQPGKAWVGLDAAGHRVGAWGRELPSRRTRLNPTVSQIARKRRLPAG